MSKSGETQLSKLFHTGQLVKLNKGELVIISNRYLRSLFYIHQGFIGVFSNEYSQKKSFLAIYKAGEIFPLESIFRNTPPALSFYTLSYCLLMRVSMVKFKRQLQQNHVLTLEATAMMSELSSLYMNRLTNIGVNSIYHRLVVCLLIFNERFGEKVGNVFLIRVPLTQNLIAQLISTSRETVTRELSILGKKGLVVYNKSLITILDKKRLKEEVRR